MTIREVTARFAVVDNENVYLITADKELRRVMDDLVTQAVVALAKVPVIPKPTKEEETPPVVKRSRELALKNSDSALPKHLSPKEHVALSELSRRNEFITPHEYASNKDEPAAKWLYVFYDLAKKGLVINKKGSFMVTPLGHDFLVQNELKA